MEEEMSKFFHDLKKGLEEVVSHKKGKITLHSESIEIPQPPLEYKAKDIKKIRGKGRYSRLCCVIQARERTPFGESRNVNSLYNFEAFLTLPSGLTRLI